MTATVMNNILPEATEALQKAAEDYNNAELTNNYDGLTFNQTSSTADALSKQIHDKTLEKLDVAGKVVLEIGCAGGEELRKFEGRGAAKLIGVDQNPLFLNIAGDAAGPGCSQFIEADMHALPLETSSVDIIISRHTLHYSESIQGLVQELCRVLRPGGQLIAVFNVVEMKSGSPFLEAPVALERWFPIFIDFGERKFTARNCASSSQEWHDALDAGGFNITLSQQLGASDKWNNSEVQYKHHDKADLFTQTIHAHLPAKRG